MISYSIVLYIMIMIYWQYEIKSRDIHEKVKDFIFYLIMADEGRCE